MAATIKRFDYSITKMKESDPYPFDPIVRICLARVAKNNKGEIEISPDLMTEDEIDHYIGELKSDLDAVGKRAKSALKSARASTMDSVSKGKSRKR